MAPVTPATDTPVAETFRRRSRRPGVVRTALLALLLALGATAVAQDGQTDTQTDEQTQEQTQSQDAQGQDAQSQDAQSQQDQGAAATAENPTVIEIGDERTISEDEFDREFERAVRGLAAQQGIPYNEQTRALFDQFRRDFLEQLAVQEALQLAADERGITIPDEEVQAQVEQARGSFPDPTAYEQALADFGYESEEAYRQSIREGMRAQRVIDELRSGIEVSDEEVQTFYDENPDLFTGEGGETAPLDQVREQVRQQLVNERLNERLAELRAQHDVLSYPERLTPLSEQQGAGQNAAPAEATEPEGAATEGAGVEPAPLGDEGATGGEDGTGTDGTDTTGGDTGTDTDDAGN